MSREHSGGAVLGAFLLGGLVGAAIALLTAPKSGRETRQDVYEWTEGAASKTRDKVHTLAQEGGDRVRGFASAAGERVRGAATDAGERVKAVVARGRERLGHHESEDIDETDEPQDPAPEEA